MSEPSSVIDSIWNWIKNHVAIATFLGVVGLGLTIFNAYEDYYAKQRIDFWQKNQQTLSDVRLKAEEINDLCQKMDKSPNKKAAFAEVQRLSQENLKFIDQLADLNFEEYKLNSITNAELKKFLEWNYQRYQEIIIYQVCPSEKILSDDIDVRVKKIQDMISKDMGRH